jgi:hypothetical protein
MAGRIKRLTGTYHTAKRIYFPLVLEELESRVVPTLLGQQLFPADNPWNQPITNAPVAANSAAVLQNLTTAFGDGRLHPDFGQDYGTPTDLYGIPYNVVHGNSTPRVNVVIDAYAGESDLVPAPIPANAVLEGDLQSGPRAGLANRGDSHLLVFDVDNNVAYEFFAASRPSENTDGKWHADQETVWDMKTNSFRTLGWTSADAAGLPILAGLARPDEGLPVSQGGQGAIHHAIRFTLQNSIILNQYLYPASHTANPGNTNAAVQPPMGARFRLKAGVDLSQLNPQSRVIAQAMKDYGLILADNGSNFFFSGASYAVDSSNQRTLTWDDNDIQDTTHGLKSLHFSDFEMVDLTPRVTGLSTHTGLAGTSVTVTGQNFSGAAGHLQVLFGSTPATSVNVVDDSHVVAVVPAGSGTVDVRVQSGIHAVDSRNVNNPIFGYGISAVSSADQFTYSTQTISSSLSTVQLASAVVVVGSTDTVTIQVRDTAGNPIGGLAGTAFGLSLTGGTSGGSFSAVTATATPGTYTATFRAATAGTASSLVVTVSGVALAASPSLTVTPAPGGGPTPPPPPSTPPSPPPAGPSLQDQLAQSALAFAQGLAFGNFFLAWQGLQKLQAILQSAPAAALAQLQQQFFLDLLFDLFLLAA